MNNEQLRINLMVDYVDWVDRDYADISQSNWRGVLSNDQINSWHNNTFRQNIGKKPLSINIRLYHHHK
jgi:hypothetical protein